MRPAVEFFVAGLVHGEWDLADLRLRKGDVVQLECEPENPHDPNAIRVDWKGRKLGYFPKATLAEMQAAKPDTRLLSKKVAATYAEVLNFAPSNPTHRMVLVGLFMEKGRPVEVPKVAPFRRLILGC